MSDEFDVVHLDEEETQNVVEWAVRAAAMVLLLSDMPEFDDDPVASNKTYERVVELMSGDIPECLVPSAITLANESVAFAVEAEATIEEFKAELDEL